MIGISSLLSLLFTSKIPYTSIQPGLSIPQSFGKGKKVFQILAATIHYQKLRFGCPLTILSGGCIETQAKKNKKEMSTPKRFELLPTNGFDTQSLDKIRVKRLNHSARAPE
jgi:hypothetical protein